MYPIKKALDEIKRLEEVSINRNPSSWDKDPKPDVTKICYLNTRSLVNKFDNIKSDLSLQQSDVMVLAETWISGKTNHQEQFQLKDYKTHLNSTGRGRGLAVFHKNDYNHISDHNEENINVTKIESDVLDVIAIYRSADGCVVQLSSIL